MKKGFVSHLFGSFSLLTITLSAGDPAQPPIKKEKIPIFPHIWVSGSLLSLQAKESGLSFATEAKPLTSTDFKKGKPISPHFLWNYGVRIDLGYEPKEIFYFASWTGIQNKARGNKDTPSSKGFYPTLSLNPTLTPTDYVTSSSFLWKLNAQLFDVGAMVSWRPSTYFLCKLHLGIRIASLNQESAIAYGGGSYNLGIDKIVFRNDFLGSGIRLGISPHLTLPQGFSFIGDISLSTFYGRFFLQQKEHYRSQTLFRETDTKNRFSWALDAKAGVNWQKEFLYKALLFSIQAGLEWQEFYQQNQLLYYDSSLRPKNRNLILRGGFLSFCLAF